MVRESKIHEFMHTVYDHEGASALYNRLQSWTDTKHLKQHCKQVVSSCDACQKGKTFSGDRQAWHDTQGRIRCRVPWAKVYSVNFTQM